MIDRLAHIGFVMWVTNSLLFERVVLSQTKKTIKGATGVSMSEVKNGLYSIQIRMTDGARGHATGVLVLVDGTIMGGDTHFYYTGFYTFINGKWRGELTTRQHAEAIGFNPLFGGREVTCGFTGVYSDREAEVDGTALVGKTSVSFTAKLTLKSAL